MPSASAASGTATTSADHCDRLAVRTANSRLSSSATTNNRTAVAQGSRTAVGTPLPKLEVICERPDRTVDAIDTHHHDGDMADVSQGALVCSVELLSRHELEQLLADSPTGAAVLILDLGNLRIRPLLGTVMPELASRASKRLRRDDRIALVGEDQLGVLTFDRSVEDLEKLAADLHGVFDTPIACGDDVRALHGSVCWVHGEGDLLWRALQANAAAVETMQREIFATGLWGGRGLDEACTLQDVADIVQSMSPWSRAVELVVHGRRFVSIPSDLSGTCEPVTVPLHVHGREIGAATWYFEPGMSRPDHPQYWPGISSAIESTLWRIIDVEAVVESAMRDPLTGLLNRRGGDLAVAKLEVPYAVALLDLDDFKAINSRLGLPGGDAVLVAFACLLSDCRPNDLVIRWGGEEFAVVLPGESARSASVCVERILQRCVAEVRAGDRTISFSGGIASAGPSTRLADAVAAADPALQRAKQTGKSRINAADVGPISHEPSEGTPC